MKKKLSILLLLIVVVSALIACVACKSKTEPVYQGMTIARNNTYAIAGSARPLYANGQRADETPNNGEFVSADDDGEINKDVEDIITIEVAGDDTVKYYVKPNETFIVQVHISNPDDYEIQSFTLNGQKYANYMFRQGSTMELLLLEVQAPSTSGYLDLTIDAIKYIDGTEIKDVRMDGSKTIKAGVAYQHGPTATVTSESIDTTKATFTFNVTDTQDIIGENAVTAYLTDGDKKIAEKSLKVGSNTVTFDNLTMGKTYQYGIATSYDLIDGNGVKARWLLSNSFSTLKAYAITNGVATQDSVTFDVSKTGDSGSITTIKLLDYKTNSLVATLSNFTDCHFDNLLSNHAYKIQVDFTYTINGGAVNDSTTTAFTTLAKTAPTVNVTNATSTQTSIGFDVATTDVDGILNITAVELYNGETLAKTATNVDVREFTDLLSNNEYTVKVTYSYDLNDGNGVHTQTATANKKTIAKTAPTVVIENTTSTQTTLGFGIATTDVDGILNITAVELYNGETLAKTLDKTANTFNVSGLATGTMYTIKVTYTYNLNDGDGVHTEYATKNYPTLVESVAVTEVSLVNNNQVRLGEEINLRIYFDNPSNIQLTNIYVNGQRVQVSGGDRKTYAIVRFATVESGLIDFYVDRVDYNFAGVEVNQHVDSLAHVTFPVFEDIDVKFEGVSASPYEYTGSGIYFYFDNPQGYKVYKVNDSTDFTQISDHEFYITTHQVTSIEYGYDNYGATTQALNLKPYDTDVYILEYATESYIPVYTTDDFINMSGKNYYVLMNDLDMRNVSVTQQIALEGYFNGNGHTIRGLHNVIDTSSQNYFDLFGKGGYGCSIFDVNFTEMYFSIVNSNTDTLYSVSLLGRVRLYNCTASGDFNASGNVELYNEFNYDLNKWEKGLIGRYNNSNTFNLNTIINGVDISDTTTKVGVKIEPNNAIEITDDGVIYYHLGDSASILLGCYNKDIAQLTICDDTIKIWASAFNGCSSLTSVVIGNSVTSIDRYAFYKCSSLTSVYYTGNIAGWCNISFGGSSANPLNYAHNLHIDNQLVKELVIPDTVTSIKSYAFYNCTSITSVTIPDSVKTIGSSAFYKCSSLTSVIIPDSVTSIYSSAFQNCSSLTSITIPDSVATIGYYAFSNCSKLQTVYYTGTAGDWAKISIENDNTYLTNATRYYECKEKTYTFVTNCDATVDDITTIVIGKLPVVTNGDLYFAGWYKTPTFDGSPITNGYYSEVDETFYAKWIDFDNLTQSAGLEITNGVITGIGSCTDTELIINMDIADNAFEGCKTITSITIGEGCLSVGKRAFRNCSNLTTVTFLSTSVPNIASDVFAEVWNKSSFRVYVPQSAYEYYASVTDSYWQQYIVSAGKLVAY